MIANRYSPSHQHLEKLARCRRPVLKLFRAGSFIYRIAAKRIGQRPATVSLKTNCQQQLAPRSLSHIWHLPVDLELTKLWKQASINENYRVR